MLRRFEALQQRGKKEGVSEPRISAAADVPRPDLPISAGRGDRSPDSLPSLRVRVEHDGRPVGSRAGACNEVGHGDCVVIDEIFVLRGERSSCSGVGSPVDADAEPTGADSWCDVDVDRERGAADLLEPETVLLDEVEREPVGPGWSGSRHRELDLPSLAGCDRRRKRRPRAIPDDRIVEPVEPVERGLDAIGPV